MVVDPTGVKVWLWTMVVWMATRNLVILGQTILEIFQGTDFVSMKITALCSLRLISGLIRRLHAEAFIVIRVN